MVSATLLVKGATLTHCSATYDGVTDKPVGSFEHRAPEVLEGKGYSHSSDLWALGVTLVDLFDPHIFAMPKIPEIDGQRDWTFQELMMTKLMLLFPHWTADPVAGKTLLGLPLDDRFAITREDRSLFDIAPFEDQLEHLACNEEWKELLRLLLSVNPVKRLSASAILESPEYRAIRETALSLKHV